MITMLKKWSSQIFADEEAIILLLLVGLGLSLVVSFGAILAPVFTSVVIAFLLQGMVNVMVRYKVHHTVAVSVATMLLMGFIAALFLIVMPLVWGQMTTLVGELPNMLGKWQASLLELPSEYPDFISVEQVNDWVALVNSKVALLGQTVLSFSIASLPSLLALLVYLVLLPILVFFFLKDKNIILNWFASFLPKKRPLMQAVWVEMNQQSANYIRGKVIEILIVGAASYVVFAFMGLRYSALLGLLVGLSVLIPYVGATVVTIPVMLIAYLQWGLSNDFYILLTAYAVVQALDGNVLVPLLFSEAVNLHPVAIIIAVLFFGGVWGFWGVFFAIPLATLVKAMIYTWPKIPDNPNV